MPTGRWEAEGTSPAPRTAGPRCWPAAVGEPVARRTPTTWRFPCGPPRGAGGRWSGSPRWRRRRRRRHIHPWGTWASSGRSRPGWPPRPAGPGPRGGTDVLRVRQHDATGLSPKLSRPDLLVRGDNLPNDPANPEKPSRRREAGGDARGV